MIHFYYFWVFQRWCMLMIFIEVVGRRACNGSMIDIVYVNCPKCWLLVTAFRWIKVVDIILFFCYPGSIGCVEQYINTEKWEDLLLVVERTEVWVKDISGLKYKEVQDVPIGRGIIPFHSKDTDNNNVFYVWYSIINWFRCTKIKLSKILIMVGVWVNT